MKLAWLKSILKGRGFSRAVSSRKGTTLVVP